MDSDIREIQESLELMVRKTLAQVFRKIANEMDCELFQNINGVMQDITLMRPTNEKIEPLAHLDIPENIRQQLAENERQIQQVLAPKKRSWPKWPCASCRREIDTRYLRHGLCPTCRASENSAVETKTDPNTDVALEYFYARLLGEYPEKEFCVGDAARIAGEEYEPTLSLLKALEKRGHARKIDSEHKHHLARWKLLDK